MLLSFQGIPALYPLQGIKSTKEYTRKEKDINSYPKHSNGYGPFLGFSLLKKYTEDFKSITEGFFPYLSSPLKKRETIQEKGKRRDKASIP